VLLTTKTAKLREIVAGDDRYDRDEAWLSNRLVPKNNPMISRDAVVLRTCVGGFASA